MEPGQQLYVLPAKPAPIKRFASLRLTRVTNENVKKANCKHTRQKSWRSQSQRQDNGRTMQRLHQAPVQLRANYSRGRNGQVTHHQKILFTAFYLKLTLMKTSLFLFVDPSHFILCTRVELGGGRKIVKNWREKRLR